jgi:hypothetical protein
MLHRARSLVTVLALAAAGPAYAESPQDAFFHQAKYTYCDAKELAGLWKQSMADTKTRIGRKIQAGATALKYLDGELERARERAHKDAAARCSYVEIGLTYDDIDKVAKAWSTTPADVKSLVEDKILSVGEADTRELIRNAAKQQPAHGAHADAGDREIQAYVSQDRYQYCDAKLIGALWRQSATEGKIWIGAKLVAKAPELIEKKLVAARSYAAKHADARCDFGDSGFGYDDAEKLAKVWNIDIERSKATIAQKVTDGRRADIVALLKRRR